MPIRLSIRLAALFAATAAVSWPTWRVDGADAYINFETTPVHPIALSPDRSRLAVCNLADGRLEIFDVSGGAPTPLGQVAVGIDPVSVRFRNDTEAWVVNHISDTISVVDVPSLRLTATVQTLDTPADVVFAGTPARAFVSCARPNVVQVFDPASLQLLTNLVLDAERPKALEVSPDGQTVFAAAFESGNGTTVVGARFKNLLFVDNVVSLSNAPSGGQNPAPNSGATFAPPLNPSLPTNIPPPASGLIVRRNGAGRWLDDSRRDWTEFVSGTNAPLTQRVPGWDLADRDLAIIDAGTHSIRYATGLMNICMGIAVNPASGRVAVVGTDARNEVRFEPNLNGTFVQVKLALVDPESLAASIRDLNPHLDYLTPTIAPAERDKSVGDPRAIAWSADGTRGYVAGLGSRNLIVIDADGNRLRALPIELGEGPCGLALDDARQRLYVFHHFAASISVIDTATDVVLDAVPLFDPTPAAVAAGRRHLYDTRRTSGLGQASCASCHVDARIDRLAWDLGNPAGSVSDQVLNHQGTLVTNRFHPMKGVMLTQTLQDIIGHEPFHWRGDRPDIESFNPTYTDLQGAPAALTASELRELRDFLASVRMPPNPNRPLDNSLPTSLPLPGHFASGQGSLPAGTPLPNGNAVAGVAAFNRAANFCNTCHTLPTGLGLDSALEGGVLTPIPAGPNDAHHFPVGFRLEGSLRSKNAQFRNLADRIGMDTTQPSARAGFGFGHDGSVDSLTRFLGGLRVVDDQEIADIIALLLSVAGADIRSAGAVEDPTPPSAVGRQLTLRSPARPALFDAMLALARSPTSRVDLIAKGFRDGQPRGWHFDAAGDRFQSDRMSEVSAPEELLGYAGPGSEMTITVVARGTGRRLGIDRDLDGTYDRDELDAGTNPADRLLRPRVLAERPQIPVGHTLVLEAQIPPLPAAGTVAWFKDGQPLPNETNLVLHVANVSFDATGDYSVNAITPFQTIPGQPHRIQVVPLILTASPSAQSVRQGSNAVFSLSIQGAEPFATRWRFGGQEILNATESTLVVSNVQLANEGIYQAVAANVYGSATSAPVRLGVWINPAVILPPFSQTAVQGGSATFSFQISGHPPPFGFQLRRSTTLLTNYVSDERNGFLTLHNVQPAAAGTYRILVTNSANPAPGLTLGPVTLSVLSDFDGDGLADSWEAARGLNTNDATDAALDLDLDGLSNLQEYIAGTEPQDAGTVLKIGPIVPAPDGESAILRFNAVSNRTYTIQFRDSVLDGPWRKLADFVAFPTNRVASITNSTAVAPHRHYRLVTPHVP